MFNRRYSQMVGSFSKLNLGFFAGYGVSMVVSGQTNDPAKIEGSIAAGLLTAVAYSYISYCNEDPTHRPKASAYTFYNYLESNVIGIVGLGYVFKLLKSPMGAELGVNNALLVFTLATGIATDLLAGIIANQEQRTGLQPRA